MKAAIAAFRTRLVEDEGMRRPVGLVALFVLTALVALAGGWWLMFYVAWLLLFLLVVAYFLALVGLRNLYFERRARGLRTEVGSYFDEQVVVENRSWIPKLWLEIEDQGRHPEHTASFVVSLGPYGRFVRPVHTLCRQRGVFQLGPVFAESGDPFGLFRQRRQIDGASTLVVYPVAIDLPRFGRLPGALSGGALQGERVQFTTTNVSGVREYRPGDTFNRIHWRSTARQRQLMVKEFELDPFADVWLVLDLDRETMAGTGLESVEEYAVTACASLAKYLLDEGRAVGFVCQGQVLTPDREMRQLLKILELLAFVRPVAGPSLDVLLAAEQQRFGRTDVLVVVTGSTQPGWARELRHLSTRGVNASAVFLDAGSFMRTTVSTVRVSGTTVRTAGPTPQPVDTSNVLGALAAARVPTYIVKRGDALREALASPVIGAAATAV
ncbi:MAG: DUF58 domain-containing protein [Chloroflexota bacterium]|nr:DUF58 domain-containing protein [Chloroflexota bacterium]